MTTLEKLTQIVKEAPDGERVLIFVVRGTEVDCFHTLPGEIQVRALLQATLDTLQAKDN